MIRRKLQALWLRLRHDGIPSTIAYVADACRPGAHLLFYVVAPSAVSPSESSSVAVFAGVDHLRQLRDPGLSEAFYRDKIKGAEKCYVAVWNGELAGVLWVLDEAYPSHLVDLGPREAELGHAYVREPYRGRGVFKLLIAATCAALRTEGYSGFYAVIDERNTASRKAFESCGFRCIGRMSRPLSDLFGFKLCVREGRT